MTAFNSRWKYEKLAAVVRVHQNMWDVRFMGSSISHSDYKILKYLPSNCEKHECTPKTI